MNSCSILVVLLKPNGSVCDHVVPLKEDVVMHGYKSTAFLCLELKMVMCIGLCCFLISSEFEKRLGTLKNYLVSHQLLL